MSPSRAKVAHVEDYDSDASAAKPGTRVKAQRRATAGPPVSMDRHRNKHRSTNSDSGYSSHTTGTQESKASADAKAMPPPLQPASAQISAKSKPVLVQRTPSQRNSQTVAQRSPTKATQPTTCSDPRCGNPNCATVAQITNRRNSMAHQPVQAPASPYVASPGGQQQMPYQYTYQQLPQAPYTQAPILSQPRPRTGSSTQQARPASFHGGYAYPAPGQSGPPPSSSAYHNQQYLATLQQQQALQGSAVYGSTPPNQMYSSYMQSSPIRSSPIATAAAPTQGLQRTMSARAIDTSSAAGTVGRSQPRPIQSARVQHDRTQSARSRMPGSFPDQDSDSGSQTDSSSGSESSEEEYERHRRRPRDSRLMSSSSQRRPSIPQRTVTDSAAYTRPSREALVRNHRSDHLLEDILSSDNMGDSDRTTRAVAGRPRTLYTNSSRSSRRPSVSTNASSGHTRTTAPSSIAGPQNIMVEDSKGRRVSYLSQRDRESIFRQLQAKEQQRQREDDVEAYQSKVRGARQQPDVTLDSIRKQQHRTSGSHNGHGRTSSRASSKAGGEGIKIDYGGTTFHVYGDTTVEVHAGEDGAPRMVIGSGASAKDSAYHSGSKSSSSRIGRSRGGSDRGSRRRERSIREDEYESAL